jgi:hypothetical protein
VATVRHHSPCTSSEDFPETPHRESGARQGESPCADTEIPPESPQHQPQTASNGSVDPTSDTNKAAAAVAMDYAQAVLTVAPGASSEIAGSACNERQI